MLGLTREAAARFSFLLAVPTMLRRGYQKELATGTVSASGSVVRCRQVVDEPTPEVLVFADAFEPWHAVFVLPLDEVYYVLTAG